MFTLATVGGGMVLGLLLAVLLDLAAVVRHHPRDDERRPARGNDHDDVPDLPRRIRRRLFANSVEVPFRPYFFWLVVWALLVPQQIVLIPNMPVCTSAIDSPEMAAVHARQPQFRTAVDQLETTSVQDWARAFVASGDQYLTTALERIMLQNEQPAPAFSAAAAEITASYEQNVARYL